MSNNLQRYKNQNDPSVLNPRTTSYEFFGPIGALVIIFTVPIIIYSLHFGCSEETGGCPPVGWLSALTEISQVLSTRGWWETLVQRLWDAEVMKYYSSWYLFCVIAWAILPGATIEGKPLRNGEVKKYTANAFSTFLLALGIVCGYISRFGPGSFTFLYEKWVGFVTASIIMAFLQAFIVYLMSFRKGALLALGGNTGNPIYDASIGTTKSSFFPSFILSFPSFFIGRELNPSIGSFDIKSFNELRPSMILWALIDISMACEQAVRRGGWENVTNSMWLVLIGHIGYITDALYNEPALFTTMDIISDGFGYMLSIGVLSWIPFTFSLQARYLVFNQLELGWFASTGIFLLNATGYWIFRDSNNEKNNFRNGRNPKNLKYMRSSSGSKLITSGWWGLSRHPNYMYVNRLPTLSLINSSYFFPSTQPPTNLTVYRGDLFMALSWSLPTGFQTPITYFYLLYFSILLIHRQIRDDEHCAKKYGDDWEKYKRMVPYRIFPYVY
ncbi:ERG4/ERG24 ergosterol biosynthesis protein [Dendrothele bispora CBS 962.96]|uniref:ERG4/ERG24 ergosterol biosynthesis protein n=1 Tax=Dendrothele bispora (strain CBS 962.96) TaxID=1314807 RepID=A0A4V4HDK6_DENBC|nr:ERG4/ERG24 ergosterol biosynthesis protein [Dendrothele bispora CBS 962.96]